METISSKVPFEPHLPELPFGTVSEDLREHLLRISDVLRVHAIAINGDDVWEDEVSPATVIRAPGIGAPSFNDDTLTWDFSHTASNTLGFVFQMKHAWKEGTEIRFHLHVYLVSAPGANNTSYWTSSYAIYSPKGDTIPDLSVPGNWTALAPVTHTHEAGALTSDIIVFPTFTPLGKTASSIVKVKIVRAPTNPADTVNQAVKLDSADLHFLRNSSGSRREYVK